MTTEIKGEDIIGLAGQNLTDTELRVLVGLAEGEHPTTTAQAIGANKIQMRAIERSIKDKLGAKTKTHLITRGFILGVLMPRTLCFLLAFLAAWGGNNSEFTRLRSPSRTRTNSSVARQVRGTRSGGMA